MSPHENRRRLLLVTPSHEGVDSGQEFLERKGLPKVVVGPQVQAGDALLDRVLGRQDQDVRFLLLVPQRGQQAESIDPRQH
jgi:hypothetical protein